MLAFETLGEPAADGLEQRADVENAEAKRDAVGNWQKQNVGQR